MVVLMYNQWFLEILFSSSFNQLYQLCGMMTACDFCIQSMAASKAFRFVFQLTYSAIFLIAHYVTRIYNYTLEITFFQTCCLLM